MRRNFVKIVIVLALLACTTAGLRRAEGQRDGATMPRSSFAAPSSRAHREIKVEANDGSFVLKNLRLERMSGSTILKGSVLNKTGRKHEQVSFVIRAYDRDGKLLKGLETETIFTAQELKAKASVQINHGYGVWLQGISLNDIARIEISEPGQEINTSALARAIPLAKHVLDSQRDSEIEE